MRQLGVIILCLTVAAVGCTRNRPSKEPPIHLNQNMDDQPRYKAQAPSEFFSDGKAMRQPVEGTVARGVPGQSVFYTGRNANGELVKEIPVEITMELVQRGHERYDIFCSPCHSRTGDGQGIVTKRGLLPPPTFHDTRLREIEDGHIFDVITNGIRNMPPYRYQIPVEDRWAIVAYFRALQFSHNAPAQLVPDDVEQRIDRMVDSLKAAQPDTAAAADTTAQGAS